jgi:hypothetical protein
MTEWTNGGPQVAETRILRAVSDYRPILQGRTEHKKDELQITNNQGIKDYYNNNNNNNNKTWIR